MAPKQLQSQDDLTTDEEEKIAPKQLQSEDGLTTAAESRWLNNSCRVNMASQQLQSQYGFTTAAESRWLQNSSLAFYGSTTAADLMLVALQLSVQ